jgi:hypothetical protein
MKYNRQNAVWTRAEPWSAAERSAQLAGGHHGMPCLLMAGESPQQSGLPFAGGECGRPETERPEDDGDEVLNPTVQRGQVGPERRHVGSRSVHEYADDDVDHDEKASPAEKGLDEAHVAHLFSRTLKPPS